jgi:mannose-1-phosphate guanylyltransferase/mannose-6-phosphate isomerase
MSIAFYPVILSGGKGSRLWPLSREKRPKQLLPLYSELTMLQDSARRVLNCHGAAPVFICNDEHRFIIAEQLRDINVKARDIILEPVGRDTAAAAVVAALRVYEDDPQGNVLVLPSDHVITDETAFKAAIDDAIQASNDGYIVTFGIGANRPETGYGYIKAGEKLSVGDNAYLVAQFVEKPDVETAQAYLNEGGYSWNSGMFMFRADVFLEEAEKYQPDVVTQCRKALAQATRDLDFCRLDAESFSESPSISLDYGVMEHTKRAAVISPVQIGWDDIGAWDALWDVSEKDAQQNVVRGAALIEQSTGCFVHTEEGAPLATLLGVEDLIVVSTDDAILVADKNKSQDVKKIVNRLKDEGYAAQLESHLTVYRPWGEYRDIDLGGRYRVKRITVKPGCSLSLQRHHHRSEHWIVVRGTAEVTRGDEVVLLTENQSTYISVGEMHRLTNPGKLPLHLIEVQCGAYLGEDDIVRYEDHYGRDT